MIANEGGIAISNGSPADADSDDIYIAITNRGDGNSSASIIVDSISAGI